MTWMSRVFFLALFVALWPALSYAETGDALQVTGISNDLLMEIGGILFTVLILSILFETALTPIFNWRIFLRYAEGRGWKTPIITVLAFVFFWGFNLDIVTQILGALTDRANSDATFGGQVLTALLIAGGSDGVFRIFARLNIRNPQERQDKARAEQKPTTMTLEITRDKVDGPVTVFIDNVISGEVTAASSTAQIPDIRPGTRELRLEGRATDMTEQRHAETLTVAPGIKFTKRVTL